MFEQDKKAWRRVYKSLLLLDYLVKNGSERVIQATRDHLYDMRALEHFAYVDEKGKDQGINVRQRSKELMELIQSDERLREERKKSKKNRDKYVGVSSEGKTTILLINTLSLSLERERKRDQYYTSYVD